MFIPRHSFVGILSRSLAFLAPEDPGRGGNPPKPKSIEDQLAEARTAVSTLTTERDQARSDLASRTTERDTLQSQFDDLTSTSNQLRTDLNAANGTISTLTAERDTARNDLASARANITRLETLCGAKGINPQAAVPVTGEPVGSGVDAEIEALQKQMENASPEEKFRISAKIRKLRDGAE